MKLNPVGKDRQRGFTLMEVLVAVVILGIVMATTYAAFRSLIGSDEVIGDTGRELTEVKTAFHWMVQDLVTTRVLLRPAYRKPNDGEDPDPFRFLAETESIGAETVSRLSFAADNHLAFGGAELTGVARIVYSVRETEGGRWDLFRRDDLHPYPDPDAEEDFPGYRVCRNVGRFRLQFVDGEGEVWDEWDSDSETFKWATPRSVRMELELGKGEGVRHFETEVVLPVWRKPEETSP